MALKQKLKIFFYKFKVDKNYQLGLAAVVLVLGAGFVWLGVWYSLTNKLDNNIFLVDSDKKQEESIAEEIVRDTPRKIDGVMVATNRSNLYPVAVMIENLASDEVRPQFGLSQAQVVYEAIVEGGITRFMAIFASGEPIDQIGPVRSARPTYLEFVSEYNAYYAHAGGSPESLAAIDGMDLLDCSALGAQSKYFWRDTSKFAPHNLFTSSEKLAYGLRDDEILEQEPEFDSWEFKDDEIDLDKEDQVIKIDFSTPAYLVEWKYNKDKNNYRRFNAGLIQKDANTDNRITAKNIIVQIVPEGVSAGDEGRINFNVTGEGKVYVFRDREVIEGTWKKEDRLARTKFYDESHEEIELNRGKTWIEILPQDRTIEYN